MVNDIYDPLDEYINVFKDKFIEVSKTTFAELAAEANVDIEQNRRTCAELYGAENSLDDTRRLISRLIVWRAVLWLAAASSLVGISLTYNNEWWQPMTFAIGAVIVIFVLFNQILPQLKEMKNQRDNLEARINQLHNETWLQMEPLNRLYDWDVLTRMMTQTVPRLEFDPYFTTQRLADLKAVYDWDDSFNDDRSVIFSHSGLINGNPFIICRTRRMQWGEKTYHGSLTIYWTETKRDSNGNTKTVSCSQTLHASISKPFPVYDEKTQVFYGNTAAPNLIFNRHKSGFAGKESSLSHKWQKYKLRRKARNLKNADYAMLTNEDFEVAFNTSDRNNNQEFAMLFSPLAQQSMMALMVDNDFAFGDDFDFLKNRMINTIESDHLQQLNLDLNPSVYHNFDYDKAEHDFYKINAMYFRAIYFSMAPLLCVPMYQQIRPLHDIYGRDMKAESSFWEHESLANFWGHDRFKHPDCVTDCILKTGRRQLSDGESIIDVKAYGYRTEPRVTYVRKFGGDGRYHNVPVQWDEYLPVVGEGSFHIREDSQSEDASITCGQRFRRIQSVLRESDCELYRRHIASKA